MALITYHPLVEQANAVAYDWAGLELDGAITGATLGATGPGDDLPAMSFDGVNDDVNLLGAGLIAAFNGAEGSVCIWGKVSAAGVWTDSTFRIMLRYDVNSSNLLFIRKSSTDNTLQFTYIAGAVTVSFDHTFSDTGWFHVAMTFSASADEVKCYVNGVVVQTLTTLGTFSTSDLTVARLGSNVTPLAIWDGFLARHVSHDTALTPAQIASLASISP